MRKIFYLAVLAGATLSAGERMNVSICSLGEFSGSVVARAKAEVQAVFTPLEVQIEWQGCDEGGSAGSPSARSFTLRLRNDRPPQTAGSSSLDAMGRAFLPEHGAGYLADAYFQSVQELAGRHQIDAEVLLGFVIAHELGHLLLGPGHAPDGVMRARWNSSELKALRQRWLQFNRSQRLQIQHELQPRIEGSSIPLAAR